MSNQTYSLCRAALVLVVLLLGAVPTPAAETGTEKVPLSELLDAASKEASFFPAISGTLTQSPSFTAIWRAAEQYLPQAKGILMDRGVPERSKLILAYAMQNAPLPQLLGLQSEGLSLCESGLLTADVLKVLVLPGYDWNTSLQEHYEDSAVRNLLVAMKSSAALSEKPNVKEYIDAILSGSAARDIARARADGQVPDRGRHE